MDLRELMSVIGIVLWFGSFQQEKRKWHLIGALAHVPPLAANILFWNLFSELGMSVVATLAVIAHCIFISVELFFAISNQLKNLYESKKMTPREL